MAEKEVKIKVSTETDTRDVEDLEDKLQELKDTKLQMQLEADTQELDDVNSQIEETQSKLDELRADPTVDDSEIQALEDELAELESRQIELEIAVNTAELDQAKASMDELESSSQGATSSIDGVGSALTAVAATAGLEKMVETADNINNSWNRLELTFAGTGVSIDQLKQKQNELSESTGQTGGTIRNFFNDMGIAGVTNTNLLGSAFESLAGKAYQTNSSVEEMEGKFQRMVMKMKYMFLTANHNVAVRLSLSMVWPQPSNIFQSKVTAPLRQCFLYNAPLSLPPCHIILFSAHCSVSRPSCMCVAVAVLGQ